MSRYDSDLDFAEWLNGPDPADVVAREDEIAVTMTCVECHGPIPTPTPDPFRCPTCRRVIADVLQETR